MRYREPWSLFRRRFTPDGPAIWYYRTYDEHGAAHHRPRYRDQL